MARSTDKRKTPGGTRFGGGPNRAWSGAKRYGGLSAHVPPGDELENSRDHNRIWEWLHRLSREIRHLRLGHTNLKTDLDNSDLPGLNFPDDVDFDLSPGGQDFEGGLIGTVGAGAQLCSDFFEIKNYRAAYHGGYRLQVGGWYEGHRIGRFFIKLYPLPIFSGSLTSKEFSVPETVPADYTLNPTPFGWGTIVEDLGPSDFESVYLAVTAEGKVALTPGELDPGSVQWRWVKVAETGQYPTGLNLPEGDDDPALVEWNPLTHQWEAVTSTLVQARVGVRADGGTTYTRKRINFRNLGSRFVWTATDDSSDEEVDIDVALSLTNADISASAAIARSKLGALGIVDADVASGAEIAVAKLAQGATDQVVTTDGSGNVVWADPTGGGAGGSLASIVFHWSGEIPANAGTQPMIHRVPQVNGGDVTFTLAKASFRVETAPTLSSLSVEIEKDVGGGGVFTAVSVSILSLAAGDFEEDDIVGLGTVTSGDLLRLTFLGVDDAARTYNVQLEGTE